MTTGAAATSRSARESTAAATRSSTTPTKNTRRPSRSRSRSARTTRYAEALYKDSGATLENLREAVTTLEEMHRIARRVLGDAHPLTTGIVRTLLRKARPLLRARKTPPSA